MRFRWPDTPDTSGLSGVATGRSVRRTLPALTFESRRAYHDGMPDVFDALAARRVGRRPPSETFEQPIRTASGLRRAGGARDGETGWSRVTEPASSRALIDRIASDPGTIREIEPSFFTAIPDASRTAPYDARAVLYDAVVGRSAYHRVLWGTSAGAFARFARRAADAADGGWLGEAGCGSLLFTHPLHEDPAGPPTLLVDRSVRMLRRGRARLRRDGREVRPGVVFLHADAGALPLRSGAFSSILSLNLLHVPCDASAIAHELGRLLAPSRGRLFASCLLRSGRWSDAYLGFLARIGELRAPWTFDALLQTLASDWGVVEWTNVEGNMGYFVIRHAGRTAST